MKPITLDMSDVKLDPQAPLPEDVRAKIAERFAAHLADIGVSEKGQKKATEKLREMLGGQRSLQQIALSNIPDVLQEAIELLQSLPQVLMGAARDEESAPHIWSLGEMCGHLAAALGDLMTAKSMMADHLACQCQAHVSESKPPAQA